MTTWLVAKTGSNANGGTSIAVNSTGTDGIVSSAGGTTKITSISATWTSALVGQGIYASSGTILRLISAVQAGQTIATAVTASGLTTFTSAALFNATMLGCAVSGPGIAAGTYISAYTSTSSMTLSAAAGAGFGSGSAVIGPLATTTGTTVFTSATAQTWNVGGMLLTVNRAMVTASGLKNVIQPLDEVFFGANTYPETVANTISGSQLATTYNGVNGSSLATLGSVITLTSVTGLATPPAGCQANGQVITSAGNVGFTYTGVSGSTLTGVIFQTNQTVLLNTLLASAGTYTITITGYSAYTAAWNVSAATLQTALSGGTYGPAGTTVTGPAAGPGLYNIVVPGGLTVAANFTGLTGGTPTITNPVTPLATIASGATLIASIPIYLIGDVDGAKTGQAGQVILSAYTSGNTSAPSATVLLALAATTNLSFSLITFTGGSAAVGCVSCTAATAAANYTFTDCTFNGIASTSSTYTMSFTSSTTGLALGITIDRCTVFGGQSLAAIFITSATTVSGAADFDLLVLIRNSFVFNLAYAVDVVATGTNTYHPGGVRVYNSTLFGSTSFRANTATYLSTTVPCELHNNFLFWGIVALTAGQITGSHNVIYAATPESNYTYGTGDVSNSAGTATYKAPLLELGQSFKWAGVLRQFLAPDNGSPLLGAGAATFSGNYPTVDWSNRNRPSGGESASASVGAFELHDFAIQDTVVYPSGGTSSGKLTGPGDQFLFIPVDASSTVITVQMYMSSGYGGSAYAAATLHASGELGTAVQTQTCSSTLSTWQTLTFSAVNPSKQGYLILQLDSYDSSGTATVNFGAIS